MTIDCQRKDSCETKDQVEAIRVHNFEALYFRKIAAVADVTAFFYKHMTAVRVNQSIELKTRDCHTDVICMNIMAS